MGALLRVLLIVVGLSIHLAAVAQTHQVTIGILAISGVAEDTARWQPLADYLDDKIKDADFRVQAYEFQALEQAIQNRQVDLVITNPADYLFAAHRMGLSAPLASIVEKADGQAMRGFGGTILVSAKRMELQQLRNLKDRRIAIINTRSFGGYQSQAYELAKVDVFLPTDAQLVITGQPYDTVLQALLDGKADAAFVRTGMLEHWIRAGKVAADQLRVLNAQHLPGFPQQLSTSLYPERPVAAMPQLDENLAKRIAAALLEMNTDGDAARAIGIHVFTLPYYYESVRQVTRALRLPPYDKELPITLRQVWTDHRYLVIAFAIGSALILGLLLLLLAKISSLREARKQSSEDAKRIELERARLRDVLQAIPDMVWLKNADGVYQFCNPAFERLYAVHESNLMGKTDYDFVDRQQADFFKYHDRLAVEAGMPTRNEEWLQRLNDGYEGLYQTIKTPIYDDTGALLGVLGIARDISELRAIQHALNERIKEQRCLNDVFSASENLQRPLPEIWQAVVEQIPAGWQYPERSEEHTSELQSQR